MAVLAPKVEIGLDLGNASTIAFKLDDAVKGKLDNTDYILGGELFYDVSNRVRNISTKRGKNQALDKIDAGNSSILFDNSDRFFDPLYPTSPFYGYLLPRREVRISSNAYPVFYGFIEDLDFEYQPGNVSTTTVQISDGFSTLTNSQLPELTPTSQLPGARISYVLDQAKVNWPATKRQIDTGTSLLLDTLITEGTAALQYLQLVTQSDFGDLFIAKNGDLVFNGRKASLTYSPFIFTDDQTISFPGTKVSYLDLNTVYGAENLYNRIVISNSDAVPDQVILENTEAGAIYGIRTYSATELLTQQVSDLTEIAQNLLDTYQEPRYRFESVSVNLDQLDSAQTLALLDLEIGDIVAATFTPNQIPPAISFATRIIGISHSWTPTRKQVTFSLDTLTYGFFVLDSASFGVLDTNTLA